MSRQKISQSFNEVWLSFLNTVKAAYELAPFLVIVIAGVVVAVTYIAVSSANLMMGVVLLLVLGITIIVYATTDNFGEAALALVAGLLTAYSVTWTPSKFVAFIAVWSAFSFSALLISSIKLASRSESLYRQAAIAICESSLEVSSTEKRLQEIGKDSTIEGLGPIEKAETILIFAHRKLPIESQSSALKAVSILSVITQLKPKIIGSFIADAYKVFDFVTTDEQSKLVDVLYKTIKESPVAPEDFINAFENSRRLILSRVIHPTPYLKMLKESLESGISPEGVYDHIHHVINKDNV